MDERKKRTDTSHGYQNQTFEEQFAERFSAERIDAEKDTEGTDDPPENPQREPTPPEALMRAWEQITEHANAVMAVFTILIFVATTAYAVIAILQWNAMRGQLEVMQDTIKLQRPWIGPTGRTLKINQMPNEKLETTPLDRFLGLDWHFKNGGTTVATHVRGNLELKIGPRKSPGAAYPTSVNCERGELPEEGFVAIPNFDQAIAVRVTPEIAAQFNKIHQDRELYLVGCVDYSDATRKPLYRTEVREIFVSFPEGFSELNSGNDAH